MPDLLLEIGTEELPARFVQPALDQLAAGIRSALAATLGREPEVTTLGTHRRLTVFVPGLLEAQPAGEELVVGPPAQVAFDDAGEPTKAALGFARSAGLDLEDLEVRDTERGRYLCALKRTGGRLVEEVLLEVLPEVITGISFPKSMYWQTPAFRFARPIRYLLALLDEQVLPLRLASLEAGRTLLGHAFLAPEEITLERADLDLYLERLQAAHVVADQEQRRDQLRRALQEATQRHGGRFAEEELLDEVTFLVELVNVVEGSFPQKYLDLPREVLEAAMKNHQRYFPVHDAEGNLVARFLFASNRPPEADDAVRTGNERVLVARLFDARFFWQEDRRGTLADRLKNLEQLIFQEKLGSYREKTDRLVALAETLSMDMGLSKELQHSASRAALLAKADLTTEMVTEFPELQGIMGREYARADGEPESVCLAIAEQYLPRRAQDPVPVTDAGAVVALADRLDTLAGCFAVGLVPTGSADPYALRRAALGVLRILVEKDVSLSLTQILREALEPFAETLELRSFAGRFLGGLLLFFRERLTNLILEQGQDQELVRAVLAAAKDNVTDNARFFEDKYGVDRPYFDAPPEVIGYDDVTDVVQRLEALEKLAREPGWRDLVKAVERTHNITREYAGALEVNEDLLAEAEEQNLWRLYQTTAKTVENSLAQRDYLQAAETFARTFARPLHVFFEKVFVNVEDDALKSNRLALLKRINLLISESFADLSQVYVE